MQMKASSDQALLELRWDRARADFNYIDASYVLSMSCMMQQFVGMLNVHETPVYEDFSWRGYMEHCCDHCIAMLAFLQYAAQELEIKETVGQV